VILQEQFRIIVNHELEVRQWNRARLAREMGVKSAYVSNYLNGDKDPGDDVKERFFNALGLRPRLSVEPLPENKNRAAG